jgi:MutS domain V
MKACLLYAGRGHGTSPPLEESADVRADLELDALLHAMADGDEYLRDTCCAVLRQSLTTPDQIRYRQAILTDCLRCPAVARAIYSLAADASAAERQVWAGIQAGSAYTLFLPRLRQLRTLADEHAPRLVSAGLTRLTGMLQAELDDAYLAEIGEHLRRLEFKDGVTAHASIGPAGRGENHVLGRPDRRRSPMLARLPSRGRPAGYELVVPERDVTGKQALTGLRDQAIGTVASALAESCEHIRAFFDMLRAETGFYVGCLNLHERLTARGEPMCMPAPEPAGKLTLNACKLRNPALLLTGQGRIIGNDVSADGKSLIVITGANQGGKTTFLRSIGLAQLMMQAGMFVTAESFTSAVCPSIRTHFRRPEDATMSSGKLDEELGRMSAIIDAVVSGSMVLSNESFAATSEREGSQLAGDVIRAMLDCGIRVLAVTHFHELAQRFSTSSRDDILFLRAGRESDGGRTFRIVEGAPLTSSHARDIYDLVFGDRRPSAT